MQLSVAVNILSSILKNQGDMQIYVMPELTDEYHDIQLIEYHAEEHITRLEVIRT
jgi:hypothetical protein